HFEDNWVKHEEAAASYADLRAVVKEYAKENADHRSQANTLMNNTMDLIERINAARVDKRTTLLKSLNRVSETLEADSTLKAAMQAMLETKTTTSSNIASLTELLRNAKFPEILTQLNSFQTSFNSLSSQCASITESLKEDPEFNQRLLRVVEGYIQNSARLTEIASSMKELNFPSLQSRITNIENTQVTMQSDIAYIKTDTYAMNEMVTKIFQAFKRFSSSTTSGSTTIPTVTPLEATATVGGGEF
ncbi:hypothetical protein Tco_0767659, partial [Tanacetum coccineum]